MPGNFWKQFGDTYDQVNQTLGGLPDVIKGAAQKAVPVAMAGMSNFDQAMIQGLPGQIATGLWGKILPQQTKELLQQVNQAAEQGRQEHPIASGIGTVGALAGQMVTGPSAPAAAAGTAAAKLGPTLGRNFLTSAAQTVPGAIAQGIQTGDVGTAIKQGAIDTGIGTLFGAGSEKILGALPSIVNAAKKTLMGQAIRGGMEVDPRALRKVATYGPIGKFAGTILDRADDLKQQLVNLMVDNPSVKTEAGRRAVVQAMDDKWSLHSV